MYSKNTLLEQPSYISVYPYSKSSHVKDELTRDYQKLESPPQSVMGGRINDLHPEVSTQENNGPVPIIIFPDKKNNCRACEMKAKEGNRKSTFSQLSNIDDKLKTGGYSIQVSSTVVISRILIDF